MSHARIGFPPTFRGDQECRREVTIANYAPVSSSVGQVA
jgi:hypothetical protein